MFDTLADLTAWYLKPETPGTVLDYYDHGDAPEDDTDASVIIMLSNGRAVEITEWSNQKNLEIDIHYDIESWYYICRPDERHEMPINQIQSLLEEQGKK